jgi:hypothetical protein
MLVLAVGAAGLGVLPAGAQTTVAAPPRAIRPALDCHSDASTAADFNRDGVDDVAIAAPFDDLFDNADVGSLNVVYGVPDDGLDSLTDNFFSPGSAGLPAFKWVFGSGRLFGKGMAAGDFNDDGYSDLAVGAPGAPADGVVQSGAVFVFYGTADGISTKFSQALYQGRGFPAANETGDSYGWAVAAGDFDGDGVDDLAVGGPGEDVGRVKDMGAVIVIYGRPGARSTGGGLSVAAGVAPKVYVQGRDGLLDTADSGDMFGVALASGNFNGDASGGKAIDDLAVGVPQEDIGTRADTGAVQVVYGSTAGLTANDQLWHQDAPSVEGGNETSDLYGCALAAGNFSGLRFGSTPNLVDVDALAIGVPGEDVGQKDQGGVNVLYPQTNGNGLSAGAGPAGPAPDDVGDQYFIERPGLAGLGEAPEAGARFGQSLNAQNLDPVAEPGPPPVLDPAWELVIGVPGAAGASGQIFVIGGVANDGLRDLPTNSYVLDQDTLFAHRGAEAGDEFGASIGFGDYDDDGDPDIVIGAPRDSSCGLFNETGEILSVGPAIPVGGDEISRAGAALTLMNDGSGVGPLNGPIPHLTSLGLGNWSLTRCDLIVEETDIYGLTGEPQANARFSHTVAGL